MKNPFTQRRLKKENAVKDVRSYLQKQDDNCGEILELVNVKGKEEPAESILALQRVIDYVNTQIVTSRTGKTTLSLPHSQFSEDTAKKIKSRRFRKKALKEDAQEFTYVLRAKKREAEAMQKSLVRDYVEEISKSPRRAEILALSDTLAAEFNRAAVQRLKAKAPRAARRKDGPGL